jgi:hypothetical protein
MAVITGTILGVKLLSEPYAGAVGRYLAEVSCKFGAYATADTCKIAAVPTAIQNARRDGKTVTMKTVSEGLAGQHGGTEFYFDTLAISSADITGELSDKDGTEIAAANGVSDRPCTVLVSYVAV